MKKYLFVVLVSLVSCFLVACGSQPTLEGKYYSVFDGKSTLELEVKGNGGKLYASSGTYPIISVDADKEQFTVKGWIEVVYMYKILEDGAVEITEPGDSSEIYYKENSKALEKALKESKEE